MNKKTIIIVACSVFLGAIAAAFITNLLFKCNSQSIFSAEWGAGDALAYVGAVLGSVSTFVLGYIAYKQNDKLQKMEENNFIATNSGMLLVNNIMMEPKANIPVNYHIHSEQLLKEHGNEDLLPLGYYFTITGSMLSNSVAAMIYIDSCTIIAGPDENPYILFAKNISDAYSRTAIYSKSIQFSMTVLIARKNKKSFEEAINANGKICVEFDFKIVTDKYVSTKCKCRSYCFYDNNNVNQSWLSDNPMVFFCGNEILDRGSIRLAGKET